MVLRIVLLSRIFTFYSLKSFCRVQSFCVLHLLKTSFPLFASIETQAHPFILLKCHLILADVINNKLWNFLNNSLEVKILLMIKWFRNSCSACLFSVLEANFWHRSFWCSQLLHLEKILWPFYLISNSWALHKAYAIWCDWNITTFNLIMWLKYYCLQASDWSCYWNITAFRLIMFLKYYHPPLAKGTQDEEAS